MAISRDEIMKVASLSRLELADQEAEVMADELAMILSYVDKLSEVDTGGVEPTTHVISLGNAFREDEVKPSLSQEEALANGPVQNGEAFVVPKVL